MIDQTLTHRVPSVLQDPKAEQLAAVYADAFLRATADAGVESVLEEFRSFVEDVLGRHPEFYQLLVEGMIGRDEKLGIIDRAIAPHGSPLFVNFLRVLARHDRLDLLPNILQESQRRFEEMRGQRRVQIRVARELTPAAAESVKNKLAESLPFEPILEFTIDPALLGGMVIRVGDTVYDSSLRSRLEQLRVRFRKRSVHEIQSGRDRFSHPEGD